jgi:hypothetical protein
MDPAIKSQDDLADRISARYKMSFCGKPVLDLIQEPQNPYALKR